MKKFILLILTLSFVFQVGCVENEDIADEENTLDAPIEVSIEDNSILERSEKISDYVVELYGIDDSSSIIFNQTVLVTVVMSYDVELNEETEELIQNVVLEKDQDIKKVIVSDDEQTFTEVSDIIIDLINDTPYDSQVENITKLIEKTDKSK